MQHNDYNSHNKVICSILLGVSIIATMIALNEFGIWMLGAENMYLMKYTLQVIPMFVHGLVFSGGIVCNFLMATGLSALVATGWYFLFTIEEYSEKRFAK